MPAAKTARTRAYAIHVALLYAALAGAWILLSDKAMEWLTSDPKQIVLFSVLKGLAFVAVSALALWALLRRGAELRPVSADASAEGMTRRPPFPFLPVLAAGLVILALAAAGIFHTVHQQEALELARLRAIADLKARQIVDWLQERQDDANFIASAHHLTEAYQRWRGRQDETSGERLRHSLREFIQYNGFHGAQVLDARAEHVLWDSEALPGAISAPVHAAGVQARTVRKPVRIGPYRDANNHLHLDFIVALPTSNAGAGPIIVLHVNLLSGLFPMLQTWPGPSPSGEVVWFRRDGSDVLFLNELRHRSDTAAKLRLPLVQQSLSARVLRGEVKPGQAVKGLDYRGIPVFGVAHAVPDTDWLLLVKLDQSELYAEAYRDAAWVALAGVLALFALGAGVYLLRQRRELAIAEQVWQAQGERLRALRLLAAFADSSSDAIFAKDTEGRFILFNRAAQRFSGRSLEEALGHDETALFPPELARRQLADNQAVIRLNQTLMFQEEIPTPAGVRIFLTTKGPLLDNEGQVIGLYGIARDITEQELAAAALRREMELNQRYLDTTQTLMVALDGAGRITMINRKGRELLGYEEDELLGRNWFDACLPQPLGRETVYPAFQRIMAGDLSAAEYFENPIRHRDGGLHLIAWHNAYFTDQEGRIIGTLSSGEDITERKRADELLHAQQRLLAESQHVALIGSWEIDLVTGHLGWSEETYRLYGITPEGFAHDFASFLDLVHPGDRAAMQAWTEAALSGAAPGDLEFRSARPEGAPRQLLGRGLLEYDAEQRPCRLYGTVQDVTERKDDQAALHRQAEELKRRNTELERFNRATVGRELDMIELKRRVNGLCRELGRDAPYPLDFLDPPEPPAEGGTP